MEGENVVHLSNTFYDLKLRKDGQKVNNVVPRLRTVILFLCHICLTVIIACELYLYLKQGN